MLTIFTTAKPFKGHVAVIQTNALTRWTLLRPKCRIILIGNEDGSEEAARAHGALHIPDVKRTEFGIPLVSDLFRVAQERSENRLMCFVNADVILMQDFMEAVKCIASNKKRFLAVGRRWNLDVGLSLNFDSPVWAVDLVRDVKSRGKLYAIDAMDYFVFPKGFYRNLPPMAVGGDGWDNWMLRSAEKTRSDRGYDAIGCGGSPESRPWQIQRCSRVT